MTDIVWGFYDIVLSRYLHGDDGASDTYGAKIGAITADGVYFRFSVETLIEDAETLEGLWTMSLDHMPIIISVSSTFIMHVNQVCKKIYGGITEVCVRQRVDHKHDEK